MSVTRVQDAVELRFPAPGRPISVNEHGRGQAGWFIRERALRPWREAVWAAWIQEPRPHRALAEGHRCRVEVNLPFRTQRTRDPHNYVGSVVKVMVDQLVHMRVWPDDSPEWVTVPEPTLSIGGEVVVRLMRV